MNIQTFSVVIGTPACNASCPFCVSHTTGFDQLPKLAPFEGKKFEKAVQLAKIGNCTTLLFTGKGEPTLYPAEIKSYLVALNSLKNPFPFVEIQTNAIQLGQDLASPRTTKTQIDRHREWYDYGLTTIAISTVGVNPIWNKQTYLHHRDIDYPDLKRTVNFLHEMKFSVRLCVMMQNEMVDDAEELLNVIEWCKENGVAQLTVRPIRQPLKQNAMRVLGADKYTDWITKHGLSEMQEQLMRIFLEKTGNHILTLMQGAHQAKVYDVNGQNVCMADCLTVEPNTSDIRTLIFFSDGKLSFDWQYPGARLL